MKGLLIGGSSHCGKSTLARAIGGALSWTVQSTDELARHPGRPWLDIPAPVAEFYETLSDESIYWFLRVHHSNMWPLLTHVIEAGRAGHAGFVFEGSALRPERIATVRTDEILALCLCAAPDFLVERIKRESGYNGHDERVRRLIDAFITRSLRDNDEIMAAARQHDVWLVDVTDPDAMVAAADTIVREMTVAPVSRPP